MCGAGWKLIFSFGALCAVLQIQPSAQLIFGVCLTGMFLNYPDAAKALTKTLTNLIPFLRGTTDFLNAAAALLRELNRLCGFKEPPQE